MPVISACPMTAVVEWVDAQALETLYLSAITVAELRFVVATMPDNRRRRALSDGLEHRVLPLFVARVLRFDLAA